MNVKPLPPSPNPLLLFGNRKRGRGQSGSALLLTIAVLAGIVALVVSFAATQSADFRAETYRIDQARAELMAEAGLERALAELAQPAANPGAATRQDPWWQLGQAGDVRFLVGDDSFRLEIVDAGSLVNLNVATEQQLLRLPLTTEQVDSLLDWRSADDQARPEGAKDDYYGALTNPYNAALARMETPDELFLIKGFTPATLYQHPTETASTQLLVPGGPEQQPLLGELITIRSSAPQVGAGGTAKVNVNTATVPQMVQRGIPGQVAQAIVQRRNTQGTFTGLGQVFQVPGVTLVSATAILNNLQVGAETTVEGRINLNTASEAVLNTVPGFTQDVAAGVVARQGFGLASLGELTQLPGVTLQVLSQCVDWVTTGSQTFLVRVIGTRGNARSAIEATVTLESGTPRVVHRWKPPYNDLVTLWRWQAAPVSDVDLGATR